MRIWPALEVGPLGEPDLFQAALVDYKVTAIDESSQPNAWRVFFSTDSDRNAAGSALARQFPDVSIRTIDIPDENWVAKSQADLRAVQIGNTIVAPPWDVPHTDRLTPPAPTEAGAGPPLVIVIRPSMGFGTGHHASTRLCLAALQHIDLRHRRVIDVGTGSGLLAIAASRLGAGHVLGIDDDADAFHAAAENVTLNSGADVTLRHVDVRSVRLEPFDVVIANLTGALLRDVARRLRDLAAPGAHLILGGFTRTEEVDVLAAYRDLAVDARTEEEEWVCVTLKRA
jgi:ribosomal protein L11 methyltransferase